MREDVIREIKAFHGYECLTGRLIKKTGVNLACLASEERRDEAIKAQFIEKMNEYPISDAPDEIDLIRIKDYYKQN